MTTYEFDVVIGSTIRIGATDARRARDTLHEALAGSTALVVTGPGAGLELGALRVAGPPGLASIDGVDPTAALEEALRAFHKRSTRPDAPGRPEDA